MRCDESEIAYPNTHPNSSPSPNPNPICRLDDAEKRAWVLPPETEEEETAWQRLPLTCHSSKPEPSPSP
eukprot:scaffold6855_cov42-Phaeocystis_antarctica.AAC.3